MTPAELQLQGDVFDLIGSQYRDAYDIAERHGEGEEVCLQAARWMGFHAWSHVQVSAHWIGRAFKADDYPDGPTTALP